jgi:hypothetical protein
MISAHGGPTQHLMRLDSQGSIRYDPCNCMQSFRALTLRVAALTTAAEKK